MKVVMYAPAGRMIALATRYAVSTQVASSCVAPRPPAMCGRATFAIEESSTSMNVASVTVMAMIHGLIRGRQGCSTVECRSGVCALGSSASGRSITVVAMYGLFDCTEIGRDSEILKRKAAITGMTYLRLQVIGS